MIGATTSHIAELELVTAIAGFYDDPLGYVMFNFPWGEPGTALENEEGPDEWQREVLVAWGNEIRLRDFNGQDPVLPIELSVSSGHGIGKSALSSWCIKFIFDTRPFSRGTVTANTMAQLHTKTWSELAKWHKMSLTRHWARFHSSKTNMRMEAPHDPETWYVQGQTCKEENSESFAGQHAATSTSWYLFDEASAVPDKIWEVSDGGLTDGEPMRITLGNQTRSLGRFHDLHSKLRGSAGARRAITRCIDSRNVKRTNKALIQEWLDYYGEDHDFFRVRVRGLPPKQSSLQFISTDVIAAAASNEREALSFPGDPLIMGVDVARSGVDFCVLRWRRGRDARSIGAIKVNLSGDPHPTMTLASLVIRHARGSDHTRSQVADAVFIDMTGVGGGVVDRCIQLGLKGVIGVNFGDKAVGALGLTQVPGERYANRRAEMYGGLKSWLPGGAIDNDEKLIGGLEVIEYGYNANNEILLAKKDHIKTLLPQALEGAMDDTDALALTFAEPVVCTDVAMANSNNGYAETHRHPFDDM